MRDVYVVGIAGGTGSGKTTFVERILADLDSPDVVTLRHDDYYRDQRHVSRSDRDRINYDRPDALETPLLIAHVEQLAAGGRVSVPQYDFSTHTRRDERVEMGPAKAVIVEGIHTLGDERLRSLMDLKVFLDASADLRFIRRASRDVQERGRSLDSIVQQYVESVKPMHDRYVEPTRQFADVIVPTHGDTGAAARLIASRLRTVLV